MAAPKKATTVAKLAPKSVPLQNSLSASSAKAALATDVVTSDGEYWDPCDLAGVNEALAVDCENLKLAKLI